MRILSTSFILSLLFIGCNDYINEVDINELKTLPSQFYGYRSGSVYLEDLDFKKFRLWFRLDENGNAKRIFRIDNYKNPKDSLSAITEFDIDTVQEKKNVQRFIDLSRKYGFGHISIDTVYKCYFSRIEGLSQQYVLTFNDSVKKEYLNNEDFKLLENGWFFNTAK